MKAIHHSSCVGTASQYLPAHSRQEEKAVEALKGSGNGALAAGTCGRNCICFAPLLKYSTRAVQSSLQLNWRCVRSLGELEEANTILEHPQTMLCLPIVDIAT